MTTAGLVKCGYVGGVATTGEPGRATGALPLLQAGEAPGLEPVHPALHGAWVLAQPFGDLVTTENL
jgi:hypothetical protein